MASSTWFCLDQIKIKVSPLWAHISYLQGYLWTNKSAGIGTTSRCGWWHHTADPFWSAHSQETVLVLFPCLWCVITSWVISCATVWLLHVGVLYLGSHYVIYEEVGRSWEDWEEPCWVGSVGKEWVVSEGSVGGLLIMKVVLVSTDVISNHCFHILSFQFTDHLCLWSPALLPFTPRWVQKLPS